MPDEHRTKGSESKRHKAVNSGPVSHRVEAAIRARLADRYHMPGERLDPVTISDELASSVTPVRDALHTLVGAELVTLVPGGGFHVPGIDEPALKDLYHWNLEVLSSAIRAWPKLEGPLRVTVPDAAAATIAALSTAICTLSANAEHISAIARINARLSPIRLVESHAVEDADRVRELWVQFADGSAARLRAGLAAYHRVRERKAAAIVRAHYRAR